MDIPKLILLIQKKPNAFNKYMKKNIIFYEDHIEIKNNKILRELLSILKKSKEKDELYMQTETYFEGVLKLESLHEELKNDECTSLEKLDNGHPQSENILLYIYENCKHPTLKILLKDIFVAQYEILLKKN